MKKNWIKGLDRIAILLAIPMAIFGASYCAKKYSEMRGVVVYTCENDQKAAKAIYDRLPEDNKDFTKRIFLFDSPKQGGVLADGAIELAQRRDESIAMNIALKRAIQSGGDPNGTLVNKARFGVDVGTDHVDCALLPSKWKRWGIGLVGGVVFFMATLAGVGMSTRWAPKILRWVREGFIRG